MILFILGLITGLIITFLAICGHLNILDTIILGESKFIIERDGKFVIRNNSDINELTDNNGDVIESKHRIGLYIKYIKYKHSLKNKDNVKIFNLTPYSNNNNVYVRYSNGERANKELNLRKFIGKYPIAFKFDKQPFSVTPSFLEGLLGKEITKYDKEKIYNDMCFLCMDYDIDLPLKEALSRIYNF